MPIDLENNVPAAHSEIIIPVLNDEVPGWSGLAGRRGSRDSVNLFGMTDHPGLPHNSGPTRHMAIQGLMFYNRGAVDFSPGPNRGASSAYYKPGPNPGIWPTGFSQALADIWVEKDGERVAELIGHHTGKGVTMHWSAYWPTPHLQPDHKWRWNNFVLEWDSGAINFVDPILTGAIIDLENFGASSQEDCDLMAVFDPHNAFSKKYSVRIPLRIGRGQAEVRWEDFPG